MFIISSKQSAPLFLKSMMSCDWWQMADTNLIFAEYWEDFKVMKISEFVEILPHREECSDFSDDKSVGKLVLSTNGDSVTANAHNLWKMKG